MRVDEGGDALPESDACEGGEEGYGLENEVENIGHHTGYSFDVDLRVMLRCYIGLGIPGKFRGLCFVAPIGRCRRSERRYRSDMSPDLAGDLLF